MQFFNHPVEMFLVAVMSLPLFGMLAKVFWGEKFETLGETIRYLLLPDWYSLLTGRGWDDWFAETKFQVWACLCFGWVAAVTELLARYVL
jgi:hypothetical protein